LFSSRFNAGEKVVGEYGKGASLGAIEVLCDAPRPAKVVAIRDTELVKLSTSVFQFIIKKYPNVVVRFSRLVGRALLERSSTSRDEQGTPTNLTTVAVLGIGPDAPLSTFSKRLAAELMHIESTLLVDKVGLFRLSLSLSCECGKWGTPTHSHAIAFRRSRVGSILLEVDTLAMCH